MDTDPGSDSRIDVPRSPQPGASAATASKACDSNNESGSDRDLLFSPPPDKKIFRKQVFRDVWLTEPNFASWLVKSKDPYKAGCKVCHKIFAARRDTVEKHKTTLLHALSMENQEEKEGICSSDSVVTDHGSSASSGNESSSDSSMFCPPDKKSSRKQAFRDAWLSNVHFASWLVKTEDRYKAECKVCQKTFGANKFNLLKHKATLLHRLNMESIEDEEGEDTYAIRIKKAEIRYTLEIVEHNRSFFSYEHFIEMSQEALPDSKIMKYISLKRSKISAIVKNVLNKHIVQKTTQILQRKHFSIFIDESTDVSDIKTLCILARYVDRGQIQSYLLDLVHLRDSAVAEHLYECLKHSLTKHGLSINSIVGLCVDNANVMLGQHNSIASPLITANPEIVVFPCICHSLHLVVCHACKYLPSHVEDFLHLVYTYFSRSPKRQSILEDTQIFMNTSRQKMIQPSKTRWLALADCIKRILGQWNVLFTLFAQACVDKESTIADNIFESFNNQFTKAYLQFLDFILSLIVKFNLIFQSTNVLIHYMLPECHKFLRSLGINFIKAECLEMSNLYDIDIFNDSNLLPMEEIFIGEDALITISEIRNSDTADMITEFYANIKKFYQHVYQGAAVRLRFDDKFFHALEFLNPAVSLDIRRHRNQVRHILDKYPSKFNRADVVAEWQLLPSQFTSEEKEGLLKLNILEFWNLIKQIKHFSGENLFKNISDLAELCLALPHSNADVERCFSTVNQIKTNQRNRLKCETISSLTRIKLHLHNENKNCITYKIPHEMLALLNNDIYKRESIPQHLNGILLPDETDESGSDSEQ